MVLHPYIICPNTHKEASHTQACLFLSPSAEKEADPVTQVAIEAPIPVTGNAPLDPAYADEENIVGNITSKKQRSVALETAAIKN